ncbi:hypothetical protein ACTZWT_19830 [Rhodopseudomonas sp. NSM]
MACSIQGDARVPIEFIYLKRRVSADQQRLSVFATAIVIGRRF